MTLDAKQSLIAWTTITALLAAIWLVGKLVDWFVAPEWLEPLVFGMIAADVISGAVGWWRRKHSRELGPSE